MSESDTCPATSHASPDGADALFAGGSVTRAALPFARQSASCVPLILALQRSAGNAAVSRAVATPSRLLQRDAASDIAGARDMLGVNLNEEALAQRLCTYVRAGNYGAAAQVLRHPDLEHYNRDDVARAMFDPGNSPLTAREVIRAARQPAGRDLLELVRGEVTSGWTDAEEVQVGRLVDGVLGDTVARNSHNRARITVINQQVANDLERLAALFADDLIIDDDTVQSRLTAILGVTEHAVIPGLQTGVDFGDTGFAGTQDPRGGGFRDPHPSRNPS